MTSIEEYQALRHAQIALNKRLLDSLPAGGKGRSLIQNTAKELGYRVKNGAIVFEDDASIVRLYDFLIYELDASGQSVASRFLARRPDLPPKEALVLRAASTAAASLFGVVQVDPAHSRLCLRDLLQERPDFWILDIGLSKTATERMLLFARVLEVGEIRFMTGAGVVFDANDTHFLLMQCRQLAKVGNASLRSRKRFGLFMRLAASNSIEIHYVGSTG